MSPLAHMSPAFVACSALLLSGLSCAGLWLLAAPNNATIVMLSLIGILLFNSTFYAAIWTTNISMAIVKVRDQGFYDQLCVLPPGAIGANWALCKAYLHHDDTLGLVNILRKSIIGILLCIFLLLLLAAASRQTALDLVQLTRLFLDMITLAAASYIDHVQSILLGSLIGMLVPVYARSSIDARFWPPLIFLTLQIVTVIIALLIGQLVIPGIYQAFGLTGWFVQLSPPVLNLVVFYLTRASFILIAWRVLVYQLNGSPAETQI